MSDLENPDEIVKTYQVINQKEFAAYKNNSYRRYSHFNDHYDIDLALQPDSLSSRTKIRLLNAILRKVKEQADLNEIKLLVLIQPSARDVSTNNSPNYKDFTNYPGYRSERMSYLVSEICEKHNINYVNLFPRFSQPDSNDLHFKSDPHWNDKGQAVAAQITSENLSQWEIFNKGSK